MFLLGLAAGCNPTAGGDGVSDRAEIRSVTSEQLVEDLTALDANAVVLNVWATWCGPCRAEFPEYVRYGHDKAEEGIAVRFLSVDDPGVLAQVQQFLDQHGVTGPTYLSGEGADIAGRLAAPNPWSYGIPVTFIYDGDGTLRAYWEGAANYDFLDAKVQQVLSTPSSEPVTTG